MVSEVENENEKCFPCYKLFTSA